MNILLVYVILNNRYAIQPKAPQYYPDIEGKVAEYCNSNHGCETCSLNQNTDCIKFTSPDLACYRGFLAMLYFPE